MGQPENKHTLNRSKKFSMKLYCSAVSLLPAPLLAYHFIGFTSACWKERYFAKLKVAKWKLNEGKIIGHDVILNVYYSAPGGIWEKIDSVYALMPYWAGTA